MSDPITSLALAEYNRRAALAQRAVTGGTWPRLEAHQKLLPWLAIALHCGAEPEAAEPLLEDWRKIGAGTHANAKDSNRSRSRFTGSHIRALAADDICERSAWHGELADAADRAARQAAHHPRNRAACELSQTLAILSAFLGVMPARHQQERIAA